MGIPSFAVLYKTLDTLDTPPEKREYSKLNIIEVHTRYPKVYALRNII